MRIKKSKMIIKRVLVIIYKESFSYLNICGCLEFVLYRMQPSKRNRRSGDKGGLRRKLPYVRRRKRMVGAERNDVELMAVIKLAC